MKNKLKYKQYLLYILPAVVVVLVIWGACFIKGKWTEKSIKTNDNAKKAYLMGYNLGKNTEKMFKTKKERQVFVRGLRQGFKGKNRIISQEDIAKLTKKERQKMKQEVENNQAEGQAFLKQNSQKEGVKQTSSGLQYKVLRAGQGQSPKATDTVEVHYRGTLINGQEFDSSYKRKQSISFPLNRVIKGWTEGLQLMKEGAKYEFYIPSGLAYGAGGAPNIPPHSVLIFQVELIKVQ